MPTFKPSQGYGEALWYGNPSRTPLTEIEEAREAEAVRKAEEVASSVPGAPRLPVGNKDLVLLTGPGEGKLKRRPLYPPFWERTWFWPVVVFSVALGVVSSSREQE